MSATFRVHPAHLAALASLLLGAATWAAPSPRAAPERPTRGSS